ncbi:MAG TPA: sulfatase-like hydrolase/transferase, partial [Sphingobacteriaceae bacterium]
YDFVEKARDRPWYKNTLFVIVADHGHRLPTNQFENYHPNRYKIPLLFFGDVIKEQFRGKIVNKIGSQTDIATTLLSQLDIDSHQFKWGKNLLNPGTNDFAFFDWDNGFGVVTPQQSISFDNVGKNVVYKQHEDLTDDDVLLGFGKAYMQCVFEQYITY